MFQNSHKILLSPVFLSGLFLLLLNDFFLKPQFGNFLTGKLSDFAGLFIFPLFFAAFFPKRKLEIYILTGVLFVFWKSSFSQSLIDSFNSFGILRIGRTVDFTDLFALLILPLSFFYFDYLKNSINNSIIKFPKRLAGIAVILFSLFAFTATTSVEDRSVSLTGEFQIKTNKNEIETILKQNENIIDLKIVWEGDFYPNNTEFEPNGYFVNFQLKKQTCDSMFTRMSFHIQQEKEVAKIKALNAWFECKPENMKPDKNTALKNYEQELSSIFEREVILKLRQNNSQ